MPWIMFRIIGRSSRYFTVLSSVLSVMAYKVAGSFESQFRVAPT